MNLFLLAAGEGTRFRPHTLVAPKPALPFCGSPLLFHSYYLARSMRPQKIVINTFHLPQKIHEIGRNLQKMLPPPSEVVFSDEQPILLGSAGGMALAKKHLDGPNGFIAMNADEIILPTKDQEMLDFQKYSMNSENLATLMVMEHPEAGKKFGAVWVDHEGRVKGFGKVPPSKEIPLRPFHFIGPMYFKRAIFDRIQTSPSNILHDTLNDAIADGQTVGIYKIQCQWFETGNLSDYLEATGEFLKLLKAETHYLKEWKTHWLKGYQLLGEPGELVLKHHSSVLPANVKVEGFAVIGVDVTVPEHSHLHNVVIGDHVAKNKIPPYVTNELIL